MALRRQPDWNQKKLYTWHHQDFLLFSDKILVVVREALHLLVERISPLYLLLHQLTSIICGRLSICIFIVGINSSHIATTYSVVRGLAGHLAPALWHRLSPTPVEPLCPWNSFE